VALESMLVQHPDVLEAGVVAVPDEQWGERPKAYITVKAKDGQTSPLRPEAVIEWAKNQSNISRYMVPREVEIVDELPKTSTGKIQKNVLREWAKKGRKV
jgi:acyl-coenzyme A synthetase/AMP-(fatty) acid ligase